MARDSPHVPISFLYLKCGSDNQYKVKTSEEEKKEKKKKTKKKKSMIISVLNFIYLCL